MSWIGFGRTFRANFMRQPKRTIRRSSPATSYQQNRFLSPVIPTVGTRKLRQMGLTSASRLTLAYWKEKALNPEFHPGLWGGFRVCKYPPDVVAFISLLVWSRLRVDPCVSISELLALMNGPPNNLGVTRWWISNLFQRWRWSLEAPCRNAAGLWRSRLLFGVGVI